MIYFNNMLAPWQAHDFMTAAVEKGTPPWRMSQWLIYKALPWSESRLPPQLQAPLSGSQLLEHSPALTTVKRSEWAEYDQSGWNYSWIRDFWTLSYEAAAYWPTVPSFHTPLLKQKTMDAATKSGFIVLSASRCHTYSGLATAMSIMMESADFSRPSWGIFKMIWRVILCLLGCQGT